MVKTTPPRDPDNNPMDRDDQMILSILTVLSEDPTTTQKDLATQLGVAVGMVNSYIKRVVYKGYVKTTQLERRRLSYLLTPRGLREKTRLTYEFLKYSYQYIRKVRQRVHEVMAPYARDGKKQVIFYGSGEVAELAYLAIRELGMEVTGIVDPPQAGKRCLGLAVQDFDWLLQPNGADVLLVLAPYAKDFEAQEKVEQFRTSAAMKIVDDM